MVYLMNKQERNIEIWKIKQLFELNDRRHVNCIRFSKGETREHIMMKCIKCLRIRKGGLDFITEGRLIKNGKIPDITVLDPYNPYHIEILNSETEEMCNKKDYPFEIRKVFV